jgi:hypothetical protein
MLFQDIGCKQDRKDQWHQEMEPLIKCYMRNKAWRDQYLQLADPATLFLALMHAKANMTTSYIDPSGRVHHRAPDPVPVTTIDSVLRSHPNIQEIRQHLKEMPSDTKADAEL